MISELEFMVTRIHLPDNSGIVEVDTSLVATGELIKKNESGIHRMFSNFVVYYSEYLAMNLKVGDRIKLDISIVSGNK